METFKSRLDRSIDIVVAAVVGGILAAVVLLMWNSYTKNIHQGRRNKVEITGHFITDQLRHTVEDDILQLQNLKKRIEETNGEYGKYWGLDAGMIIEQNPSFKFVEWIDSNMIIRKIVPAKGNEPALGLDISNIPYRRDQWIKSRLDSSLNITQWAQMTQGGNAFLVDAPTYFQGRFQGTITAGLVFNDHFDNLMVGRDDFCLRLYDNLGEEFYSIGDTSEMANNGISYTSTITISEERDQRWMLELGPSPSFYESNIWYEKNLGLVLGMMLALMMAITLFLLLRSSRERQRISQINDRLQLLNDDLTNEKARAEKASVAKSEFLSNMSHEIRTPLNAILGLIDILKKQFKDEGREVTKYLDMMSFSSKNLLGLLNDVLEIDRIESGMVELNEKEFLPAKELNMLIDLYGPSFKEKGVYLKLDLQEDQQSVALGDVLKYNQVLTNLLRNAFKFTQKGGVSVRYKEQQIGDRLKIFIEIEDTGIGIPQDKLIHIFERFSQVETGYTRKYEGTGLGLAISKMLVDNLGGSITVESTEGMGTVFKVNFSFYKVQDKPKEEVATSGKPGFEGAKILIAEDNPMNVLVISKLLEEFGISTEVAKNGKEAVEMAQAGVFDLIFMDVHMPEMDGLEATRILKGNGVKIPIVALSANITKAAREEADESGIEEYVTKPFTREAILRVLNRFLS